MARRTGVNAGRKPHGIRASKELWSSHDAVACYSSGMLFLELMWMLHLADFVREFAACGAAECRFQIWLAETVIQVPRECSMPVLSG
jgi:hypothetical protein